MEVPIRSSRVPLLFVLIALAHSAPAQQVATNSPDAAAILRRAFSTMSSGARISSTAIAGSATRYDGSVGASGTFAFSADSTEQSRFDFSLPTGTSGEIRTVTDGAPSGSGIAPGGVVYAVGPQNPMTASAWFFPALTLAPRLAAQYYGKSYVGKESRNGVAVSHLQVWRQSNEGTVATAATVRQLSLEDVYLDWTSHLPVAITFSLHSIGGVAGDTPVEVDFSDYQMVQGSPVPYHIRVYMAGALFWDIQVSSVSITSAS